PHPAQVERHGELFGRDAVEQRARSAHHQIDEVDARADQHDVGRNVAQLDRYLQGQLRVALAGVDEEPQADGGQQRQQLEAGVVQQQPAQRRAELPRSQPAHPLAQRHPTSSFCSVLRRVPASRSRVMRPSTTSEMPPSSSDTAITTASLSSVMPMAARWRVPSVLLTVGLAVSGRKQAAAVTRPLRTTSAPSWMGEAVTKTLRISSLLICASSGVPPAVNSLRPVSRSKTIKPPMRRLAIVTTARMISSRSWPARRLSPPNTGRL